MAPNFLSHQIKTAKNFLSIIYVISQSTFLLTNSFFSHDFHFVSCYSFRMMPLIIFTANFNSFLVRSKYSTHLKHPPALSPSLALLCNLIPSARSFFHLLPCLEFIVSLLRNFVSCFSLLLLKLRLCKSFLLTAVFCIH